MKHDGLVVIVSESEAVITHLTETFEAKGSVVLQLDDGGELRDYLEVLLERPNRRIAPRLLIVDESAPGPRASRLVAWAKSRGLELPLVVFRASGTQRLADASLSLDA